MKDITERLTTILTKATERVFGSDASGEVYYDELSFDEEFDMMHVETDVAISGKNVIMTLAGLTGSETTFCVGHKGEESYHLNIFFWPCNDDESAGIAAEAYDESEIAKVLEIENEICEGDTLMLSAVFAGATEEEAINELANILGYIVDEEKSKPLFELLKYFD